jgi:hypothetical protein
MKARVLLLIAGLLVTAGAAAGGCQTGGVGDPCTPEDEYLETFAGFSATEVNIESRSFQCETRLCLVNHFRGRVSCPLGQTQATAQTAVDAKAETTEDPAACRIPGSKNPVTVAVNPQCRQRTADLTVYCSCRCAGPDGKKDDGGQYCDCPDGYSCQEFRDFNVGDYVGGDKRQQLRGSYCVKDNTEYAQGQCAQGKDVAQAIDPCRADGNCGVTANP